SRRKAPNCARPAIEVSESSVGPKLIRVGSGRRMGSRRRAGRLPPTMSRRTFEVLDGVSFAGIATAKTVPSGDEFPLIAAHATRIGAKSRLITVWLQFPLANSPHYSLMVISARRSLLRRVGEQ